MLRFLKTLVLFVLTFWLGLLLVNTILPPISMLMAARVLSFRHVERHYVPLARISPQLVRAVIAAEDARFCSHQGVDWPTLHAVAENVIEAEDDSHGGSTIPMQTAKNLFLWMGYPYVRKPIEVPLALLLDAVWSKRRMMENYLNVAEFGRGVFGAEAASQHYFRKSAKSLSAREAALLAAVLPSPNRRNPARPSPAVRRYAASIAGRMGSVDVRCVR